MQASFLAVLTIVTVDVEVLLQYLNYSFTEFKCWKVVGSRKAYINFDLLVQFFEELEGKLQATIGGDIAW